MKAIVVLCFLLLIGSVNGYAFKAVPGPNAEPIDPVLKDGPSLSTAKVQEEQIGSRRSGLTYGELMTVLNATRVFDFETRTWGVRSPISEDKKLEVIQKWKAERHQA